MSRLDVKACGGQFKEQDHGACPSSSVVVAILVYLGLGGGCRFCLLQLQTPLLSIRQVKQRQVCTVNVVYSNYLLGYFPLADTARGKESINHRQPAGPHHEDGHGLRSDADLS